MMFIMSIVTRLLGSDDLDEAVSILHKGGLVVFPTETVYGLGANAFDEAAVRRIFVAKDRPADNPLIVHLASFSLLERTVRELPDMAWKLMEAFWPGPLTLVLPASDRVAPSVKAGLNTVGVRWPAEELALRLLERCPFPLAAPSANRSGRPSPTSFESAWEEMNGRVEAILHGPSCSVGLESTVVGFEGGKPLIFRPGGVSREWIEDVLGVRVGEASESRASPGTRHPHYRPSCSVRAWSGIPAFAASPGDWVLTLQRGLELPEVRVLTFDTVEEYARELYRTFFQAEREGVGTLWCELPPETGVGQALRDRILRAVTVL